MRANILFYKILLILNDNVNYLTNYTSMNITVQKIYA